MDEFSWGMEFMKINAEVLEAYADCETSEEVVEAQVFELWIHFSVIRSIKFN